jgi:AcrR family transcriptional regulator
MGMEPRELLVERALELFTARGYDGVGVQEIVEAAGVTKPTLYHHFGSKRGLLRAVLDSRRPGIEAALAPAREYAHDLTGTLRRIVDGFFTFARENPVYVRLTLSLYFAPPQSEGHEEVAALNELEFSTLRDLFVKASRDHGNMRGRHVLYAASFLGMINNLVGLGLNGHLAMDRQLVERSVHYFEHGIYS